MKLQEIKQLTESTERFLRDEESIRDWLKDNVINYSSTLAVITQGKVLYMGDVSFKHLNFGSLAVEFVGVHGNFLLNGLRYLHTLEGCPRTVEGSFEISNCRGIRTFDHIPEKIKDSLRCRDLQLDTLIGIHEKIKEVGDTIDIRGTTVKKGGIGLLLIKGRIWKTPDIWASDSPIYPTFEPMAIIEKHARQGDQLFECQAELIERGFEENAEL